LVHDFGYWGPQDLSPSGRLATTWNMNDLFALAIDPAADSGDQKLTRDRLQLHAAHAWDGEDLVFLFKAQPDKPPTLWNERAKRELARLEVAVPPLAVVDLRPTDGVVAIFGKTDATKPELPPGGTLSVSDTRTGKALWTARLSRDARRVSLSSRADRLLVTELGPRVEHWGIQVFSIADECRVFDVRTGAEVWTRKDTIWEAQYVPGDRVLLQTGSGNRPDRMVCLDSSTGSELWALPLAGHLDVLTPSPDGKLFAFAEGGRQRAALEVRDLTTGELVAALPRESASTSVFIGAAAAFTPDSSRLAVGRSDGSIRIWDTRAGLFEMMTLRGHSGPVASLAFTPDGSRLISVGEDAVARVWDATHGEGE
jgi:WD40 repeat protein